MPPLDRQTTLDMEKPLRIEMKTSEGLALLATLQLALRHPEFKKKPTAQWIKMFADGLQKGICQQAPGLTFLCDAGWKEEFDR